MAVSVSTLAASALAAQRPAAASVDSSSSGAAKRSVDLSGVLYASFQYGGDRDSRSDNRFDIDRAYLTARAHMSERLDARVTLDVYQQRNPASDDFYQGWAMRAKYAYVDYALLRGGESDLTLTARFGLLQTAIIEVEEQVWNRGLGQVGVDRFGYVPSADAGVSSVLRLPDGHGEFYLGVTNGSGYASRETDRFKDVAARFTWTPAPHAAGVLSSIRVSPWAMLGRRGSDYAAGAGTVAPVAAGLRKNRAGVLLSVRDPRITLGTHVAWRFDESETADTTVDTSPRTSDVTGRLISLHALLRPRAFSDDLPQWPLAVVLRTDEFRAHTDSDASVRTWFAGLMYEAGAYGSITLDYQRQLPHHGSGASDLAAVALQLVASF
ncbi:MAG TPA: hypothetical protein VFG84_06920 [Gemmatimonadaceae bacterium]|nr:hypothetical protein [Gemmatimonadaceae bacterium]